MSLEPRPVYDAYNTGRFGQGCLLARRLLERGVRFVQLFSGGTFGSPRRNWDGHEDIAWTYERPFPQLAEVAGMVAFWDELVDVFVDGEPRERPRSVFSEVLLDEFA